MPFDRACADHNQRDAARPCSKLECRASSSVTSISDRRRACAAYTRRWLGVGGRNLHVAPCACAEGERPLAGVLYDVARPHNEREHRGS